VKIVQPHHKETAMTADTVKARLRAEGITITQWAREHGYDRVAVYRVLGGQYRGHYGEAHEIAVKLGLKSEPEKLAA